MTSVATARIAEANPSGIPIANKKNIPRSRIKEIVPTSNMLALQRATNIFDLGLIDVVFWGMSCVFVPIRNQI